MRIHFNAVLLFVVATSSSLIAQPIVDSWYTEQSGRYARIYETTAAESAGTSVTTWSRGQGVQNQPTYAGVHEISVTDTHVYIRTSGLGFHIMGPWYGNEANTNLFPNYPANQSVIYELPLDPGTAPSTKTGTGLGAIGYFVDGIAMFDSRDAFSYSTSNATDSRPNNGIQGDGVWNRDAYVNESVTFDPANAHQAGANHHYHANPPGLRHLRGDSVSYDSATNRYTEQIGGNGTHSPILAWVGDGLPLYGPYGYSDPLDPSSGIRKLVTGYQERDGSNGSTNLSSTGRTTLPQWMVRNDSSVNSTALAANRYGPNVSNTYTLGHYLEDYAYKGDLSGLTLYDGTGAFNANIHFDLNEYNVRYCVTPEFPEGTWAYFTCIEDDGTPLFPYNIGRYYFGTPQGDRVNSIPSEATVVFEGGPEAAPKLNNFTTNQANDTITLAWSGAEGGTYVITESSDLDEWNQISNPVTVDQNQEASTTETVNSSSQENLFYRVELSDIEAFDDTGFDLESTSTNPPSGGEASSFQATFPTTPPIPPQDAATITVNGIDVSITSYDQNNGTIGFDLDTSLLDPGAYSVSLSFTPPNNTEMILTSTNTITIEEPTVKNILLLIVDDWGLDASPLHNDTLGALLANMPNLQALADQGLTFNRAYSQPTCSPMRATMLTGRQPFQHGVGSPQSAAQFSNNQDEITLPEIFETMNAPHAILSVGKWHLGGNDSGYANRGGWPEFYGINGGGVNSYTNWSKNSNGTSATSTTYTTTDQVDHVIEFVEESVSNDTPWFAWVAFNAAHTPFEDPPSNLAPVGGYSAQGEGESTNRFNYRKTLEALDTELGRLLESIDPAKTNIILLGDNGTPGQTVQAPFGDGHAKGDLYNGGIHVPMIVKGPAVTVAAGSETESLVHCIDVFSTILELAGIDESAVPGLDTQNVLSTSMLPIWDDTDTADRYIVAERDSNPGRAIIVSSYPDYKLIINGDPDDTADTPSFEFFNVTTDQNEQSPLDIGSLTGTALSAYNACIAKDQVLGGGYSTPAQ